MNHELKKRKKLAETNSNFRLETGNAAIKCNNCITRVIKKRNNCFALLDSLNVFLKFILPYFFNLTLTLRC